MDPVSSQSGHGDMAECGGWTLDTATLIVLMLPPQHDRSAAGGGDGLPETGYYLVIITHLQHMGGSKH